MAITLERGLRSQQPEIGRLIDLAAAGPIEAFGTAGAGPPLAAELSVEAARGPLSAPDPALLNTIDWGSQVADATEIKVYFAAAGQKFGGFKSLGWNPYEIQQAMLAFEQFENILNVDVVQTASKNQADFKLVTTNKLGANVLGLFNPPGEPNAGLGFFAPGGFGWDEAGGGGLERGGFGFITLIHEFGHGFGLAHPHDTGGGSTVMNGVTAPFGDLGDFNLNQGVFTTMSYNDGNPSLTGSNPNVGFGYQASMMALDVAVLQDKYGARADFHSGNDTYVLDGVNAAGTFYECIWDTGGKKDAIVFAGNAACLIDLRAATLDYSATGGGPVSYVAGIFGGFTIANGVAIENASGGKGDDILIGNKFKNALSGGKGDDTIGGGAGIDTLTGGDGQNVFAFLQFESKAQSIDVVKDYDEADDLIDISYIDADQDTAGHQTFTVGQITATLDAPGVLRIGLDVVGNAQTDMEMIFEGYGGGGINFIFGHAAPPAEGARAGWETYELVV